MKKMSIMSLAIEPELQDSLKNYAKRRGQSVSAMIREMVTKFISDDDHVKNIVLKVPEDESIIPVVLKIPADLKNKHAELKSWLEAQSIGILNKLAKNES